MHALNTLKFAPVPAQTPITRKGVIIDGMSNKNHLLCMHPIKGFYRILLDEWDIPYTAVCTPSGILWDWLVVPQELSNAPVTFNRCVTNLLRPVQDFALSYFDDRFFHTRAMTGKSIVEVYRTHVRQALQLMRKHRLYAKLKKRIFSGSKIPRLVPSWVSTAYGVIPKRSRQSPNGQSQ